MPIVSLKFLLFFPAVVMIYYALPRRARNPFLLVAGLVFYFMYGFSFGLMLLWVIGASYVAALRVQRDGCSRWALVFWLAMCLGPMLFFKIKAPVLDALPPDSWVMKIPGLNWAVVVGLSCYTLQAVGYVVEVYKRRVAAERSLLTHALFVSFLPTVTSGPIQHTVPLLPQLQAGGKAFDAPMFLQGVKTFIWGLFLKLVVADRFGIYVNSVLPEAAHYNAVTVLLALVCLTIQIYTDFAGYSAMAIGLGQMLGFTIPENFRRPLFSVGMKELWRRWHISLSSWLRDYVYIPLGGSRCAKWRVALNSVIAFLVSGMWHGLQPTYLVWGLGNGLVVASEVFLPWNGLRKHRATRLLGMLLTVLTMSLLLGFFRDSWAEVTALFTTLFTGFSSWHLMMGDATRTQATLLAMALFFGVVLLRDVYDEWLASRFTAWHRGRLAVSLVFHAVLVVLVLLFGVMDSGSFIYLKF